MENEQLNRTKASRDYYVHLLVGITETRYCLATLREYVLSVWQYGDLSHDWQQSEGLLVKLEEQFGLQQQTTQDDTQIVSNCLQFLKHKVNIWHKEMQLHSRSNLDKMVPEEKINFNCMNSNNTFISKINKSMQKKAKSLFNQSINNDNSILALLRNDDIGHLSENQENEDLEKQVKDLLSQLEAQQDQINSLLRANKNYKDDYRNKLRTLNRSMAIKVASMNRAMIEEGNSNKKACNNYEQLLRRVTSLSSQLSEKKKEVQTLKNVVNYNRCSSDLQLRKLQDEFDEYKEKAGLTQSVLFENLSLCEGSLKELTDLQNNLATLEQENTNLRHLLSLEVTQKFQLLKKYNEQSLDRRHSLPGGVRADIPLANHIVYPMRRQHAISLF